MKFLVFAAILAFACAAEIEIVRQSSDVNPDGSYNYAYETSHGIKHEEQGVLKNVGREDEAQEVTGQFEYVSPEGQKIAVHYVANENGFEAQGDHLPVAPAPLEIPHYIQRALDWIAANPHKEEPGKKF